MLAWPGGGRSLAEQKVIYEELARFLDVPGGDKIPYVIAYHEIIKAPAANVNSDPDRCDVIYDGKISPDFYGWIFPHGDQASVGMGTGIDGIDLKQATADLRAASGLAGCETIRREGAPIPLHPMDRWDNGRDVVLAGDAAGVVAPSSGEGIYYAMVGGRVAALLIGSRANFGGDLAFESADLPPGVLPRSAVLVDHARTAEVLAGLRPAFDKAGSVTAGNASGINDGAAAVMVMKASKAAALGLKPLATIKSFGTSGLDPATMGMGPVPASQKALARAGWKASDVDLFELNEAFAAQACAVNKALDIDPARVNVNGGAIAIGHPIGASGCRVLVTLLHEMQKRGAKKGLAALCIGGGMGVSLAVER